MEIEPTKPEAKPTPTPKQSRRWLWPIVAAIAIVIVAIFALNSLHGKSPEATESGSNTVTVAAAKVVREDIFNEDEIPGEFRPYVEVELHAKVSGFVDQMNVDFGDEVTNGQVLATLEVPELHDQLRNAIAIRQRAEADYTNAHLIYDRIQQVNKEHPNLVAQQELDTARSKDDTTAAAVAAAKADFERYETLVKYTKITAPFDGVVTKRYADHGALIQAATGSDTQTMPLVRVSDNYHLRMDFPVSVKYVKDVQLGKSVTVRVDSLNKKTFVGKITRFSQRVNDDTRTMMTEIEVANPKLEIVPGMYASVIWKFEQRPQALVIPTQAVGGGNESTVYVINADHEIEVRPVKTGLETPEKFEVTSGLKENELVMIGSRAFVHPGQKVEVKILDQVASQ